jgi:putative flavoprotein involved in K+ transport
LYFLGLSWQHTRGSALLGFLDEDARHIADRIAADRATTAPNESTTAPPAPG